MGSAGVLAETRTEYLPYIWTELIGVMAKL
jgi:hypothetical protein